MEQHVPEYTETTVDFTEILWGDGFLSPGGKAEVSMILEGLELADANILDIGCGFGGVDVLLVKDHGAGHVTAIDIEQLQIDQASARIEGTDLVERIDFQLVNPGPLPFENETFDYVFSKDSIIHVENKSALCNEIYRVLQTGGSFVASDWLKRVEGPLSDDMIDFVSKMGLTFHLETLKSMSGLLKQAGFTDITTNDRHAWHKEVARDELSQLKGSLHSRLVESIGEEAATGEIVCWEAMVKVLDSGEFGSGHLKGSK